MLVFVLAICVVLCVCIYRHYFVEMADRDSEQEEVR